MKPHANQPKTPESKPASPRPRTFHRVRQSGIDEELFDVIFGFEALWNDQRRAAVSEIQL